MISKLITHGKDREEARERMIRAIDDYHISGVETTLPFCKFALKHEAFISGNFDTHFVSTHFTPEKLKTSHPDGEEVAALFAAKLYTEGKVVPSVTNNNEQTISKWKINRR
jgi:acetyl/propionyl-CoA carboxylase alpha subunit